MTRHVRDAEALGRLTSADGGLPGRLTPTEDFRAADDAPLSLESEGSEDRPGESGGEARSARGRSPLVDYAEHEDDADTEGVEARASASLLESLCTTRPALTDYLAALDRETADFRERRAEHHAAQAREALRAALAQLVVARTARSPEAKVAAFVEAAKLRQSARWHRSRARGQRVRLARVATCRVDKLEVTCCECDDVRESAERCDVVRLCQSCRGRRARRAKIRFGEARQRHMLLALFRGLLSPARRDRYSEKLLTLTIPHVGSTEERIRWIFGAWTRFARWLQRTWRRDEAHFGLKPAFYRSFEWTPGHDLLGHPHFHVWLLSPFINADEARHVWRNALRAEGMSLDEDADVVIDIKEIRYRMPEIVHEVLKGEEALRFARLQIGEGGEDAVEYASGWCIGDEVEARRVSASVLAAVYRGLEGLRLTQGSRGFLGAHTPSCPCCGTVEPRVRVKRVPADGVAASARRTTNVE